MLGECRGSVHRQDASAAHCCQLLLLTASWQYFPVWCTNNDSQTGSVASALNIGDGDMFWVTTGDW